MRVLRIYLFSLIALISVSCSEVQAQISSKHQDQIDRIEYLLALDRLDFYAEGLADYLLDHNQKIAAEAIRDISPEDYAKQKFSISELNQPDRWNDLILLTVHKLYPDLKNLTQKDIEWNYNFFRKKLMEGFRADPVSFKREASISPLITEVPAFVNRTVPNGDGSSILLDTERYISEKTTRALFWDAASTDKSIEFHLGTERDFRQRISQEDRQVIAEIKTRSANYNKIYLIYNPQTKDYSYAFTRISGDDRVKHLITQLRILKFKNKIALKGNSVRVYGNANHIHREQEAKLLELFNTLPKADLIVIGQKSAIANVIAMAGMMAQVQPDIKTTVGPEKAQIFKLSQRVADSGSYFSVTTKASTVKTEFEKIPNPIATNYEIFNSEQPSHEIADVLLETTDGRLVRWRFISNMWGDEVIPVARAIKNSGHEKVVYIGTAGALIEKGIKVGDVIAPSKTYTQEGKLFNLDKPIYGQDFVKTGQILGQVTSPFDETQKWFNRWKNKIDLVELETGYLKENLGPGVNFQPYLLISDIVGSTHETLAVAASDSSKRKNGQLKLLESLFLNNKIRAPISNFEMIGADLAAQSMFRKISSLRPSRDITSRLQLTQLALRMGLKTENEIEALIKSEPAFDRQLLVDKLEKFSSALETITRKYSKMNFSIVGGEELLNGTWNPKKVLRLVVMVTNTSANKAEKMYETEIENISKVLRGEIQLEFLNYDVERTRQAILFNSQSQKVLIAHYEQKILKKLGLNKEIDKNGGVRFREIIETSGGMRCEALLL
jgi:hypothetical protein